MLLTSTVQSKACLNAASEVVDNTHIPFVKWPESLQSDCFQSSSGVRITLVDVVLEKPRQESGELSSVLG